MGSFYGTTFKELKEAFKKLIIKKNNSIKTTIEAQGTEDSITFNQKDNWVIIDGDNDNQSLSFSHGEPIHTDTDDISDIFKILPEDHNLSITQLEPGQYFSITSNFYDEKGHKTGTRSAGFQLPQTDAEIELGDVKLRLDNLEEQDENIIKKFDNYITSDQQEKNEERLQLIEEFCDITIPDTYATKKEMGNISDMKTSEAYDKYTSITALIGNIEDLNIELGFDPKKGERNILSLSEALIEVLPKIQSQAEMIVDSYASMKQRIEVLESKVEELENM